MVLSVLPFWAGMNGYHRGQRPDRSPFPFPAIFDRHASVKDVRQRKSQPDRSAWEVEGRDWLAPVQIRSEGVLLPPSLTLFLFDGPSTTSLAVLNSPASVIDLLLESSDDGSEAGLMAQQRARP